MEPELRPSEKRTHESVGYESASTHAGERCSGCKHYIAANIPRCKGVKSPIAAGGWCRRFKAKPDQARSGLKVLYG